MLPLPYTQNKALGVLASHLRGIETKLQPVARKRVISKRGSKLLDAPQEETYEVVPKAVSDGCQATVRLLVTMGLRAVEEVRRCSFLRETATDAAPVAPPISTNNKELARIRKVSQRTIISHLHEAETVGIITKRNFRGRHANYELWISTKFLWNTDSQSLIHTSAENRTNGAGTALAPSQSTNFHPFVVLEKDSKEEIINVPVDKLATESGQVPFAGNTGLRVKAEPSEIAPETALGATQSEKEITEAGGAAAPAGVENPALHAERLMMVETFWLKAWRELYPTRKFSDAQQKLAKNAIWYGVYHAFRENLTPKQWAVYHENALQRLVLARKYFHRHREAGKRAPLPWAEFIPGTGYFDRQNTQGFVGTAAWLEASRKNFHNNQVYHALARARAEMNGHKTAIASARVLTMTRIQLYRYHEKQLSKLGSAALKEFRAQIAPPRS